MPFSCTSRGPRGLEEASSDFLYPPSLHSHLPPPEVYKAVRRIYRAYIHSQRVHREREEAYIYIYIYTCTPFYVCVLYATVSIAPCQVPARIIRGERARNTHVLARIPLERSHTHATFASTDIYTRNNIYICATHENSFPSPLLFSKG